MRGKLFVIFLTILMLGLIFDRVGTPVVEFFTSQYHFGYGRRGRAVYNIFQKAYIYIYIQRETEWIRQPSKKYLVFITWPTFFFWDKNFQNLGWRVRISIYYKLLQTENHVKRKKWDKHLPPVQSIIHLCNKFLLFISFYPISYGTTKSFIWWDGATISYSL